VCIVLCSLKYITYDKHKKMKSIIPVKALVSAAVVSLAFFTSPAFAQKNTALSDAEVASVAVAANQIDINYGEIAKKKSKNPEVLRFAETMIRDHKAVIAQAVALVKKLGVTPKDNAVSKKLLADAAITKKTLNSKSGKAFNRAYIDNEVAYHKAVISAVEGLLIPEADNKELKDLLINVVPALKAHLDHAIMVQEHISKPND
jgi:putative membrane protein